MKTGMTSIFGNSNPLSIAWKLWKKLEKDTTGGSMVLNQDFREFVQLLNAHEVLYLVVGGYAVASFGKP